MAIHLNCNIKKFRICVDADNVSIIKNIDSSINITIDIDKEETKNILDGISISEIISHYGKDVLISNLKSKI